MTRINTNIGSLTAQKALARSNMQLQQAMTRLSTGLRINTGKDDPAGLIGSEALRSDIVSVQMAVSNSQRANQVIATADSALGQVSSLLNDIRALVTEAANAGAMSEEQIAANQLQVDSSLEAINRIAQTTKFQGRGLLDGSLDFITTADTISSIENLEISQASLGAAGQVNVSVDISVAATQATIRSASGDAQAMATLRFAPRARVQFTGGGVLDIVAATVGPQYEGVTLNITADTSESVSYDADDKVLSITYIDDSTTAGDLETLIEGANGVPEFETDVVTAGAAITGVTASPDLASPYLTFTADDAGPEYNGFSVSVQKSDLPGDGATASAQWFATSKRLVITIDSAGGSTDLNTVKTALSTALSGTFTVGASVTGAGDVDIHGDVADVPETKAVTNSGITGYINSGFSAATRATATVNFAAGAAHTWVASGGDAVVDIKSASLGAAGDEVEITLVHDGNLTAGEEYAEYDSQAGTLRVYYKGGVGFSTVEQVIDAIDALAEWTATLESGTATDTVNDSGQTTATTAIDSLEIAALNPGADYNHIQVLLESVDGLTSPLASYDSTDRQLTIQIAADGATDLSAVKTAVDALDEFSAAVNRRGPTRIYASQVDINALGNTSATGGNALLADMVLEVAGKNGMEVFNLQAGASVNQVASSINLVADATGVSASQSNGLLTINSVEYGSKAYTAVQVNSEGTSGTFKTALSASRVTGTDTEATVNGISAVADGNKLSLNTATLDLLIEITAGTTTDFEFNITGGGALFQMGPEVVTNQQARLGIRSVNTSRLGGASGRIYQLASGESASLENDTTTAAAIVDEAISAVTTLRGRLGAFQKTTLDSNMAALEDTLENLMGAESAIRDADFAAETAAMTRAQILIQSGISVLAIANTSPQNVLALLR